MHTFSTPKEGVEKGERMRKELGKNELNVLFQSSIKVNFSRKKQRKLNSFCNMHYARSFFDIKEPEHESKTFL